MSYSASPAKLILFICSVLVSTSCSYPTPPRTSAVAAVSPSSSATAPTIKPSPTAETYQVIDEQQKNLFTVEPSRLLRASQLPIAAIDFDAQKLLTVLTNTKAYFQKNLAKDPAINRPGILASQGVSVADTFKTLDFMIQVLEEDLQANRPLRLQDSKFVAENFRVVKWQSFDPQAPQQKKVRITKYAVFTHPGSHNKTPVYNTALYSLPGKHPGFEYRQYTKQQVLDGIYESEGKEHGKVEPIAYLTRDGLEDALMEGTVLIKFTDGTQGLFNVDRSNEIPFVKGLDRRAQKRYWYFKKVDKIKGYGYEIDEKISIEPGVTFAGDVLNIGLGKVVAIEDRSNKGKKLRLGVIADTGGAFLPNLHQLDFLTGFFENAKDFKEFNRQLPEFTTAYFLIKK